MQTTADAVDSGLLQVLHRRGDRHRGHDRDPEPADRRPQRAARRDPRRPGQGADHRDPGRRRSGSVTSRPSPRSHQPLIGDAIIDGRPGLLLVVEKLPWANSLQMTAGVEQAIRDLQPGLPGIKFDTKVFQQADFVKLAIANLTQALVLGLHPGRGDPGAVPVRVAGRADQPAHDPAVAGRHDAGALLARRHHQHDDAGRAW